MQLLIGTDTVRVFRDTPTMESAASRLKALRELTHPKLSVRAVAQALGIPASSYAFYENPKSFKKRFLPVEFARSIATPFASRGVPIADVLALAGVEESDGQTVADRASLEPMVQLVTMQVALPSEAALARMFEGLLLPLDLSAPKTEIAQLLARRLPTGFAQLRDLLPEHALAASHAPDEAAPAPAKDHPASPPASHT